MKTFCTEGPVEPESNYFVSREALVKQGLAKVDDWRYFTLFAPRQSGKSTYFQFLCEAIRRNRPAILPLWLSFEAFGRAEEAFFLELFMQKITMRLRQYGLSLDPSLKPGRMASLSDFFHRLASTMEKEIVLIVDEIEGLKDIETLNAFLHSIRDIYHDRRQVGLRSVVLVGVSDITGILQDTASPFNIADQIDIPYFTFDETSDLLEQHIQATGQVFLPEVIRQIHDNTAGQPGLVNALARDLVEKRCPGTPEIGMAPFYRTLDAFMRVYVDKNISNVVNKARQYPEIMRQILFDGPISFSTDDPAISFLHVNGVIDDQDGMCNITVPVYKKRLYQSFKPLLNINGEKRHFRDPMISIRNFLLPNGYLDMVKVLDRYADYIRERGNIIFSGGKAQEGIYHYNLDAYLSSFMDFLGGRVFPEVPEGGGRVDLLVLQEQMRWIIEVKRFLGPDMLDRGKHQLATYIKRSGMNEGYLVVFSDVHPEGSQGCEQIDGCTLLWWILPVKTISPSQS
jgi:hypothetical protein